FATGVEPAAAVAAAAAAVESAISRTANGRLAADAVRRGNDRAAEFRRFSDEFLAAAGQALGPAAICDLCPVLLDRRQLVSRLHRPGVPQPLSQRDRAPAIGRAEPIGCRASSARQSGTTAGAPRPTSLAAAAPRRTAARVRQRFADRSPPA